MNNFADNSRSLILDQYRNLIRKNGKSKIVKFIYQLANSFVIAYHYETCSDIEKNGELYIIKSLKQNYGDQKVIVFDVGANRGQYTNLINKHLNNSTIHCFEIVPQTFNILTKNLSLNTNIILNNFGLSDTDRIEQVTWFPNSDSGSSINALPWQSNSDQVECQVISGDSYCQKNSIDQIDLLKIDTEGHELSVLKGFKNLIKSGQISVIQFEYGFTYIPSRTTLGDIYELLMPYGYSIGRLYPNGVEFKQYDLFEDETFKAGNYIAIHFSATNIIESIKI
jgi:FkbM family methyltransferase